MPEKPLVNVHIEKTGGRSARKVFIDTFGADQVLTYSPDTDRLLRASDRVIATEKPHQALAERTASNRFMFPLARLALRAARGLQAKKSFAPEHLPYDFRVITGHFSGTRFERILPPEEANYISVAREPLERMRSHYEHWRRSRGLAHFRVRVPFDPNIDFTQFALLPELQNYQTSSLGFAASRYHLLGTMDYLTEYLEELNLIDNGEVPNYNRGNYDRSQSYPAAFLAHFEEFHCEDYELFHSVLKRWQ